MTLLEAREAAREACRDGEAVRRVQRDGDTWVAVIATGDVAVNASTMRVEKIVVRHETVGVL